MSTISTHRQRQAAIEIEQAMKQTMAQVVEQTMAQVKQTMAQVVKQTMAQVVEQVVEQGMDQTMSDAETAEARAWAEISRCKLPQERVQSNHLVMQYLPTLPLAEYGAKSEPTVITVHGKGYDLPVLLRADAGLSLSGHLTVFDRHVFNAACTLWMARCRTFTLPQIYRVMHGRTGGRYGCGDEAKEGIRSILDALLKLKGTHITIDYTQELAALTSKTRNRLGNLVERRECQLLPISIDTMRIPGGDKYIAVRINEEPGLLTDALARHQILCIPVDVIDVHKPGGRRPKATALFQDVKEDLIARVTVMRRSAVTNPTRTRESQAMIAESACLYTHLIEAGHAVKGSTPGACRIRTLARQAAETVLKHMQNTGWISGYQAIMQGRALQKWVITFGPELPQLPGTIPELLEAYEQQDGIADWRAILDRNCVTSSRFRRIQ